MGCRIKYLNSFNLQKMGQRTYRTPRSVTQGLPILCQLLSFSFFNKHKEKDYQFHGSFVRLFIIFSFIAKSNRIQVINKLVTQMIHLLFLFYNLSFKVSSFNIRTCHQKRYLRLDLLSLLKL